MKILFAVQEPAKIEGGIPSTVTEGYDRDEVISDAEAYYEQLDIDYGYVGPNEKEVILSTYYEDADREEEEIITLTWFAEEAFDPQAEWGTMNHAQLGLKRA